MLPTSLDEGLSTSAGGVPVIKLSQGSSPMKWRKYKTRLSGDVGWVLGRWDV